MDAATDPVAHTPEAFAPVNGLTLCYDTFGDANAPPLLLIMGLGAQMMLWDDDFCAQLAARGFYVIRFDNRDIGRSTYLSETVRVDLAELTMQQMQGKPIASPYKLRDMAADAAALLDHLGIASVHIAGASMGGMIAQELALSFPERVRTLTSIMSSTGNPLLPPPTPEAAAVLLAPPPVGRDSYIQAFCNNWKVLRAGAFPEDEARDPARAARMYDRGTNPPGVSRQLLAIIASGDRTARLASLTAPTLVIHGVPDPLVRIEAGRATAAAIPGAKLLEIGNMGHALPMAIWTQVIDAISGHCEGK
jgi:pimeloyl-ACP methyl ester carboxylesterase